MDFCYTHVVMAYMRQYPDGGYRHAGALVEVLIDLEEKRIPTWDMTELLVWIMLLPPPVTGQVSSRQTSLTSLLHSSLSRPLPPLGSRLDIPPASVVPPPVSVNSSLLPPAPPAAT